MTNAKQKIEKNKVDTKEFEIPETVFIRDIEDKVFVSIILQCLSEIEGISLVEGNFIDHLLGRSSEGAKGIHAEQSEKNQSVNVKVEVNILYGTAIPEKAEEIQVKIANQITELTGLHVGSVHVVFKNVVSREQAQRLAHSNTTHSSDSAVEDDYADEF